MERDQYIPKPEAAFQKYFSTRIVRNLLHGAFRPIFQAFGSEEALNQLTERTEAKITLDLLEDLRKSEAKYGQLKLQ